MNIDNEPATDAPGQIIACSSSNSGPDDSKPVETRRVAEHGFSTRKEGHGFGLHRSALAAAEMGGSLRVQSDGPGGGATFTIDLPLDAPNL